MSALISTQKKATFPILFLKENNNNDVEMSLYFKFLLFIFISNPICLNLPISKLNKIM